jgi:hypothetical protein
MIGTELVFAQLSAFASACTKREQRKRILAQEDPKEGRGTNLESSGKPLM